jgi:hypothetical protein
MGIAHHFRPLTLAASALACLFLQGCGKPEYSEEEIGAIPAFVTSVNFSPDRLHAAFVAVDEQSGGQYVLADGVRSSTYEGVHEASLSSSPDGRRLAYAAWLEGKVHVVVDGECGPALEGFGINGLSFSPDSAHLAYVGRDVEGWRAYIDGVPGPIFTMIGESPIVWSGDSKRHAYFASDGTNWIPVVDSVARTPRGGVRSDGIVFSPDSQHWAFVALEEKSHSCIIDDAALCTHEGIALGSPVLSDGGRWACVFLEGEEARICIDGKDAATAFSAEDTRVPFFSPDGAHVALEYKSGEVWRVMIDGEPQPGDYEFIPDGIGTFSPDGRLVVIAKDAAGWHLFADGVALGENFDTPLAPPTFSPDGRHIALAAIRAGVHVVMIDGRVVASAGGVLGGTPFFNCEGRPIYALDDNGKWRLAYEGALGAPYDNMAGLCSSPDSRHIAYLADRDGAQVMIVDGVESTPVDAFLGYPVFRDGKVEVLALKGDKLLRLVCDL